MLAVVDGLDEDLLMTPALPSGWTPPGLIEHLGHAERHWFQEVALGSAAPPPWPEDPPGEETARHAGHLDAARELPEGQSGLGPR